MIQKEEVKNRFHIYTGFKQGSLFSRKLQCGEAYLIEKAGRTFYLVKMWAFPNESFYLSHSREAEDRYTLFAKKVGGEDGKDLTFRRPVGHGYLSRDLRSYLEIQFTFPRERVFMSLFPTQTVIDSLISQSRDDEDQLESA